MLLFTFLHNLTRRASLVFPCSSKSAADIDNQLSKDPHPDVLLLGPQVRYMANDVKKKTDAAGIPMDIINMSDYGMMNGENVLQAAEKLLGDK